jgi:hypothetical protein
MKKINLLSIFLFLLTLCVTFFGAGCEKDKELPPYHAKGKIIAVTTQCYGEVVVIEVEKPKGIGFPGTFSTIGNEIDISYNNAIGVPYFSKTGIPDYVPQTIDTWLYFEYRELTEEEKEQNLFLPDPNLFCPAIYGSPIVNQFIITQIINYK